MNCIVKSSEFNSQVRKRNEEEHEMIMLQAKGRREIIWVEALDFPQ